MTYDNFTIKAQEAILKSQQIAGGFEQQGVDTVHLIKGIIETDPKLSEFIFNKMGNKYAWYNGGTGTIKGIFNM